MAQSHEKSQQEERPKNPREAAREVRRMRMMPWLQTGIPLVVTIALGVWALELRSGTDGLEKDAQRFVKIEESYAGLNKEQQEALKAAPAIHATLEESMNAIRATGNLVRDAGEDVDHIIGDARAMTGEVREMTKKTLDMNERIKAENEQLARLNRLLENTARAVDTAPAH